MPLDPDSRRQLVRVQHILRTSLALVHSPLSVIYGWYAEKPEPRVRRRVFLTADGRVIRTEVEPVEAPDPSSAPR